jgi:hypothetical protein
MLMHVMRGKVKVGAKWSIRVYLSNGATADFTRAPETPPETKSYPKMR